MSLKDRLLKASTIKETDIMSESKFFNQKDHIPTTVPSINLACSGRLDGGITPGLTVIAGPSKHFKSNIMLIMARAYLERYPEAVMLFYDSEFGSPQSYFKSHGIDPDRVIHVPISDIEQLKFDIVQQLGEIKRGDRVFIAIDSIGNLASKKEVEDALKQSSAADMTRAKQLKSFFRMVTPHLTIKDIPMMVVNHVYMTQEMFSKPVVSGGCVLAGTQIQTPNGLKKVEEFSEGDLVLTLNGPKSVTHTWNPDTLENGTPECLEIEFEDGNKFTVSENHKFLIDGIWVEAKDLLEGMNCSVLDT